MSFDQIDELARYRARRDRDRRASDTDPAGDDPWSAEQRDAIARARESWTLSQLGRERDARSDPDGGNRGDRADEPENPLSED